MDVMSDAQLWATAIALVLPVAIAFVQRNSYPKAVKVTVMLVVAAADGVGSAYFAGEFTGASVLSCVLLAIVATGMAYKAIWQPASVAPRITNALSRGTARR